MFQAFLTVSEPTIETFLKRGLWLNLTFGFEDLCFLRCKGLAIVEVYGIEVSKSETECDLVGLVYEMVLGINWRKVALNVMFWFVWWMFLDEEEIKF